MTLPVMSIVPTSTVLLLHSAFKSAITIEQEFVFNALPVYLIMMNATLMCQYIEFCADHLLVAICQPQLYEVSNPFEWMETISLQDQLL